MTIAGIVRTWFIYRSLFNVNYDQTWYAYPLWIAAAVEIDLGVVRQSIPIESSQLTVLQICASAPVLRPLLKMIPFSLSDTISRGFSSKKVSDCPSKGSARPIPVIARKAPGVSSTSSTRKADTIISVPELNADRGKSYEMKHWDDLERAISIDKSERSSQDAILDISAQSPPNRTIRGIWDKVTSGEDRPRNKDDMTITRTDEVEVLSKRVSRDQQAQNRTSFSRKISG